MISGRRFAIRSELLGNRAVKRVEDQRLMTGRGRFAADQVPADSLFAHFVRSPHAHARIKAVDVDAARSAPGVVAVFTAPDMAADGVGSLPSGWQIQDRHGRPLVMPPHFPLTGDRARHVGDGVAVIIAETRGQAEEAAELVDVDYAPLAAVVNPAEAADPGAAEVWPEAPGNLCCAWEIGDNAAVEEAFARAVSIVPITLRNNRLVANPMEPRAVVASYDADRERYRLVTCSQNPHAVRSVLARQILKVPENRVQVVCGDVGGGFGARINVYPEDAVLLWAAGRLNRTIAWTASRLETFQTDTQARDHETAAWLALDADNNFLGLRVRTFANVGAYLGQGTAAIASYYYGQLLSGVYRIPAIHCEVRLIFTNTAPIDAYRGAGRPEATYVLERLIDKAARVVGADRIDLRRRNFIPLEAFPYETPLGLTYDCGDHELTLSRALDMYNIKGFETRRQQALARGKRLGFGISTYLEIAGATSSRISRSYGAMGGRSEGAHVRVHPGGAVTVFSPMQANGQGHETTFAQIVAERLSIPLDDVEIVEGDTDRTPMGRGSAASRSLVVGGAAIVQALDKIVAKMTRIAGFLLTCDSDVVSFRDGVFRGNDGQIGFREVARAAYDGFSFPIDQIEPGLEALAFYEPDNWTYPGGCHICEVEVDAETGVVSITRLVAADDVGNVINPMIVHGQIHGGLAQGIGQALLEDCVYESEGGQLLTASFMEYAVPRASDLPMFELALCPVPTAQNPFGAKGCAEVGTVGVPPAVVNAVLHALAPLGVETIEMPMTPERVWHAIEAARLSQE